MKRIVGRFHLVITAKGREIRLGRASLFGSMTWKSFDEQLTKKLLGEGRLDSKGCLGNFSNLSSAMIFKLDLGYECRVHVITTKYTYKYLNNS